MKRVIYIFAFALMLTLSSCDGMFSNNAEQQDSVAQQADSIEVETAEKVIRGIAIDGSRRNIYVAVGTDTLDFELSYDLGVDFSWEIGDSVIVKYYPTEYGDSVTYISTQMQ